MDAKAMKTMMKMSGDMFAITNEEASDPFKFTMPIVRPLIIGLGLGFLKTWGKSFVISSNVLFNTFNNMNSDLANFDVSHNI